jgi:CheY-like chemotaxis protein
MIDERTHTGGAQRMDIKRVLMVDDDPSILMIAQISLSKVGKWTVETVDSGKKALDLLPDYKPDVILLDVMMPGMDGPTMFKKLQEDTVLCNTPVIFMTAKVQTTEVEGYCKLGAAGVISKPFDPMTLPGEIRQIIEAAVPH